MLQRTGHALQHIAVHLALDAFEFGGDGLAELGRCLPDHALQPLHLPGERHHQGAHQALLQGRVDLPLVAQHAVDLADLLRQRVLQVAQIGHRLIQGARQLLHARVAVHFKRIEFVFVTIRSLLRPTMLPRLNLRVGFHLHLPQLRPRAVDGLLQLVELARQTVGLLFQPRVEDAHFTGLVQHRVQLLDGDPGGFTAHQNLFVLRGRRLPEQARVPVADLRLRRLNSRCGQRVISS